jgi:hypothetical protein
MEPLYRKRFLDELQLLLLGVEVGNFESSLLDLPHNEIFGQQLIMTLILHVMVVHKDSMDNQELQYHFTVVAVHLVLIPVAISFAHLLGSIHLQDHFLPQLHSHTPFSQVTLVDDSFWA